MNLFEAPILVTGLAAQRGAFIKKKKISIAPRPFHGLTFRLAGKIMIEACGKRLVSSPGDLTFVPCGTGYDTEVLENGEMMIVHFTATSFGERLTPFVLTPACPAAFETEFAALCSRFRVGKEQDAECLSLFYRILADAKLEYERQGGGVIVTPRIRFAKNRIDRDFADPSLNVASLAAEGGVSEVTFRKEFGAAFGTPPLAYLKKVRIENAKTLLMTGYYSVAETALLCGYENISYFSSEFRRAVGVTPTAFIRQERFAVEGAHTDE